MNNSRKRTNSVISTTAHDRVAEERMFRAAEEVALPTRLVLMVVTTCSSQMKAGSIPPLHGMAVATLLSTFKLRLRLRRLPPRIQTSFNQHQTLKSLLIVQKTSQPMARTSKAMLASLELMVRTSVMACIFLGPR